MGNLPWYVTWYVCLQCFDAVGWAAGRTSGVQKTEWWGAGVVIYLEQGADLHVAQLSLASVKSRLVFLFWYWLTWVVPDKGPLNVCVCVCVPWHVTNHSGQLSLGSIGIEYQSECGDALQLGASRGRHGSFYMWTNMQVAGETV